MRYVGATPSFVKVITQREFRNNSAAETYHVTRNGDDDVWGRGRG
ncbi:hypothetical protein [Kutzneria buriramensis]|uniref:Uncharacterized protein n=1 Tax=Kutzneria buriramensis TaxID=1045776 RepID=A0A3E0GXB9_9PSEU|nr:hypothetical protein [Kutzneria buriramensis]REH30725.1 hypothetical protein BCF44_12384 [Kutzneria buriramensis]